MTTNYCKSKPIIVNDKEMIKAIEEFLKEELSRLITCPINPPTEKPISMSELWAEGEEKN